MIYLSPSLLSADMARFADEIYLVKDAVEYIHCDVMDGHFVPNLTFGAPVIKDLKKLNLLPLDVHLMIDNPGVWIKDYLEAGLDNNDYLTFHIEAEEDSLGVLKKIREAGVKPGLAIKPGTAFEQFKDYLEYVDQLLIMTVEPGFGNQYFIQEMLPKIRETKSCLKAGQIIGVDGGINPETAPLAVKYGADLLVAGGAIFGFDEPLDGIRLIRDSLR
ncbi:ribulose-phosphate 3-epimerase [bacterium]|nr:ribulose-phosphate 3-epimerase [bacterium]